MIFRVLVPAGLRLYFHCAGILPMESVILLGSRNLSVIWQRLLDNQPASVKVQGSIDDPE
jgi:hypothetical protein